MVFNKTSYRNSSHQAFPTAQKPIRQRYDGNNATEASVCDRTLSGAFKWKLRFLYGYYETTVQMQVTVSASGRGYVSLRFLLLL